MYPGAKTDSATTHKMLFLCNIFPGLAPSVLPDVWHDMAHKWQYHYRKAVRVECFAD